MVCKPESVPRYPSPLPCLAANSPLAMAREAIHILVSANVRVGSRRIARLPAI